MPKHLLESPQEQLEIEPAHPLLDGSEHPYAEHLSRHPHVGLGYEAVLRALDSAMVELDEDNDVKRQAERRLLEQDINSSYEKSADFVASVRQRLIQMPSEAASYYGEKIAKESPYLRSLLLGEIPVRDEQTGEVGWWYETEEAAKQSRGARLVSSAMRMHIGESGKSEYAVPNSVMQSFAEWLAHDTQKRQAEFDSRADELKQAYVDRVHRRAQPLNLPEEALKRLPFLEPVDILVDDGFSTQYFSSTENTLGWYLYESERRPVVALSPLLNEAQIQHVLGHEQTHAIAINHEDKKNRHTFLSPLFGRYGATVMDEALTEHFNARLFDGRFDDVYPDNGENDIYGGFRIFLDTLANHGLERIDIREFYEAFYFSEAGEGESVFGNEHIDALTTKLEKAFPDIDIYREMRAWDKAGSDVSLAALSEKVAELTERLQASAHAERQSRHELESASRLKKGLARTNLVFMNIMYSDLMSRGKGKHRAKKK